MNKIITEGLIYLEGDCNIEYCVCKITHILNNDESFKFIFTPLYSVIDLLDQKFFQGIPGIDLTLHKKE